MSCDGLQGNKQRLVVVIISVVKGKRFWNYLGDKAHVRGNIYIKIASGNVCETILIRLIVLGRTTLKESNIISWVWMVAFLKREERHYLDGASISMEAR